METKPGRDPPKGKDVFFGWVMFCVAAFLGVAFTLPGEDPFRGAIWAGAASAAAALVLATWWALGYVAPPTEVIGPKALVAGIWEIPFVAGAVLCTASRFIIATAYAQGRSPFEPWWCFVGIGAFVAAGIVVEIMRGERSYRRLLAFSICLVLWAVLMLLGQYAMGTGFERPLIGVLLGAAFFSWIFKPWRKD